MNEFSQQIAQLRRDYVSRSFDESHVVADPFDQFKLWFEEAMRAEQPDVEAMTLSTISDGRISARIVLLKGFDARGFVFFTNYQSRKSRELAAHPMAALTFYWHTLNRQVRIEGAVEKASRQESEDYFGLVHAEARLALGLRRKAMNSLAAKSWNKTSPILKRVLAMVKFLARHFGEAGGCTPCKSNFGKAAKVVCTTASFTKKKTTRGKLFALRRKSFRHSAFG